MLGERRAGKLIIDGDGGEGRLNCDNGGARAVLGK